MKRSQNKQSILRGLIRNNCATIIYESKYDVHDINTCSSWLMHYLENKNEDEFVSISVKLSYPILAKK